MKKTLAKHLVKNFNNDIILKLTEKMNKNMPKTEKKGPIKSGPNKCSIPRS